MITRVMAFLNLLDEKDRLSPTNLALWGTTLINLGNLGFLDVTGAPMDGTFTFAALAAHTLAGVKHEVKRWSQRS